MYRPTRTAISQERVLQRLVPAGAAEPPRRSCLAPFFGRESIRGEPQTLSLHFPGQGRSDSGEPAASIGLGTQLLGPISFQGLIREPRVYL
jgi:hypothetical protein